MKTTSWLTIFLFFYIFKNTCTHFLLKDSEEVPRTAFMSTSNMVLLMKAEEELVGRMRAIVEKYKDEEPSLVLPMEKYITRHDKMVSKGKNASEIICHPTDTYNVIKDITRGWIKINNTCESNMNCPTDFLGELVEIRTTWNYPEYYHLNTLAITLARLQDSYRLKLSDMLQGTIIDPVSHKTYQGLYSLNAWDCFLIGRGAKEVGLYGVAINWLEAAKELIHSGDKSISLQLCEDLLHNTIEVHDICLIQKGSRGFGWKTRELPINQELLQQYQHRIKYGAETYVPRLHSYLSVKDMSLQQDMLCRGQTYRPKYLDWSLTCHYITHGDPYLRIGPFKVEQLSSDPPVYKVHEFLYESEINKIQESAVPKMADSIYFNKKSDGSFLTFTGSNRISQHTYIGVKDDPVLVSPILHRLEAVFKLKFDCGLDTLLKVNNYGIGGFYGVHLDSGTVETNRDFRTKDVLKRDGGLVATVLMHLESVEAGGATVFPVSGVAVQQVRGSATLWFNLNKAGDIEYASYHAGCPVLYGSKWIVSPRPRMNDHMFTKRKCGLHPLDTHDLNVE